MPDHVEKIHNRAYLEHKPYNDILHLERDIRPNGLGVLDETTLVPLNSGGIYSHHNAQCRKWKNERYLET